jgi:hypothetical protein
MPTVPLRAVAHTRTGDKGDISNLAVIAYDEQDYALLRDQVTADVILAHYRGVADGPVLRYEVPSIGALNFVIHRAQAGGVSRSLRLDQYGKALSSLALSIPLEVPADHAALRR